MTAPAHIHKVMEMARQAGLPVTWWDKAIQEGTTREWRELMTFAQLVAADCASVAYTSSDAGDIAAQSILYEYDVDNARQHK